MSLITYIAEGHTVSLYMPVATKSLRKVILDGKKFGDSKPYEATEPDDLKLIVQALFWIKNDIEMRIETEGIE